MVVFMTDVHLNCTKKTKFLSQKRTYSASTIKTKLVDALKKTDGLYSWHCTKHKQALQDGALPLQ
jgi:hypothetical protein